MRGEGSVGLALLGEMVGITLRAKRGRSSGEVMLILCKLPNRRTVAGWYLGS